MQRRQLVVAAAVVLSLLAPLACGSDGDEGPPPSISDATYLERPPDATSAPDEP